MPLQYLSQNIQPAIAWLGTQMLEVTHQIQTLHPMEGAWSHDRLLYEASIEHHAPIPSMHRFYKLGTSFKQASPGYSSRKKKVELH